MYYIVFDMEQSYTSIADLPFDNQNNQMQNNQMQNNQMSNNQEFPPPISITNSKPSKINGDVPTNYMPINVHQNPYGVSDKNPIMDQDWSSQPQQQSQHVPEMYQEELSNMKHNRFQSRDLHQGSLHLSNDEQIQPNYIPRSNVDSDYVRTHEDMTELNLREYNSKQQRHDTLDVILTEIQMPIFITILFFIFQLPLINNIIFKQLPMLSLYNLDGNFNLNGLILKSIIFGAFYYSSHKIMAFISEL